ncbi:hypothetical protein BU16DRAFT_593503 [Lophium mytilinum]|uniref:Uncharacterized protein n=1 Tax=Lophium mytilinum TaxID=390894 RepID=A0A6A6QIB1_9PEZI|nr:hypothetical protein BU16DRAFT_593503 [Lophium mytilinum]
MMRRTAALVTYHNNRSGCEQAQTVARWAAVKEEMERSGTLWCDYCHKTDHTAANYFGTRPELLQGFKDRQPAQAVGQEREAVDHRLRDANNAISITMPATTIISLVRSAVRSIKTETETGVHTQTESETETTMRIETETETTTRIETETEPTTRIDPDVTDIIRTRSVCEWTGYVTYPASVRACSSSSIMRVLI